MLKIFKKKPAEETKKSETAPPAAWLASDYEEEGHLAVDVYQAGDNLVVKSTIAGARPEEIEIIVQDDMLTIRGQRRLSEEIDYNDYLYRECYWGKFSRTIVLPVQVDESGVQAKLEGGVLTVILPKARRDKEVKIRVKN